jgi:magnesium chelatase family protein
MDLAIAAAVLQASGAISFGALKTILIIGELDLTGCVRTVPGSVGAVLQAQKKDVEAVLMPTADISCALKDSSSIMGIDHLRSIRYLSSCAESGKLQKKRKIISGIPGTASAASASASPDAAPAAVSLENADAPEKTHLLFDDIIGLDYVKRALAIAAAGSHHVLLFGPPGCGKTLSARALGELLPRLPDEEVRELAQIYSAAETAEENSCCVETGRPPVRMPHHSITKERMLGGGKNCGPGEISLAHLGLLIIDEASEFSRAALQSLREPLEQRKVEFLRSGRWFRYPSNFQFIMSMNPCPCGQLGVSRQPCMCRPQDIHRYWKRIGNPLLDRIPIRIPIDSSGISENGADMFCRNKEETAHTALTSSSARSAVKTAQEMQRKRYFRKPYRTNQNMSFQDISEFCRMTQPAEQLYKDAADHFEFSIRASHSILKVARTIADYEQEEMIQDEHIAEALWYRRYGDGDYYWKSIAQ